MRLRHRDGTVVHLGYCANVHPADDLDGILARLADTAGPIRRELGVDQLGVGLWLPAPVARQLDADDEAVERLRGALASERLEVVTLNGFPYAGFGDAVVKHRVYEPSWADAEREAHTQRLARILSRLLPDDVDVGTISTLPLGWAAWMDGPAVEGGLASLARVADQLAVLEARTGRRIVLAVEPEPGCTIETAAELAARLGPIAGPHLGGCLDLCHLAVAHDRPSTALGLLGAAGVATPKVQVAAGVRIPDPRRWRDRVAAGSDDGSSPLSALLSRGRGSPFLHQVRCAARDGVRGVDDLDDALASDLPDDVEWRTHLHAPVDADPALTTQAETVDALAHLLGGLTCGVRHLEVETYTWPALHGGDDRAGLIAGVAAELRWTAELCERLGLAAMARAGRR